MRFTLPFVMAGLAMAAVSAGAQDAGQRIVRRDAVRAGARAYQGRNGPEQTERFSRKVKVGRDARVSIDNVAGNIVVTGGSGDEVSIEAVKRTRGDRGELAKVRITVDERAGRVDVRTEGEQNRGWRGSQVSVDYTVTVPASASVDLHSVSGSMRVTGVRGSLRAETVSGNVTISGNSSTTGSVTIGSGTAITRHISAVLNVAFNARLGPTTCAVWSFPSSPAADGDTVAVGMGSSLMSANIVFSAWASNGSVQVRICNPTGSPTTVGAGNVRIDLWKH